MVRIPPTTSNAVSQLVEPLPPPPQLSHVLSITSIPSVTFTLDGAPKTTPFSEKILDGPHEVVFQASLSRQNLVFGFGGWSDGDPNATRTILLAADTFLLAVYLSPVGILTGDSDRATLSIAQRGGRKMFRDAMGKYLVFYVNTSKKICLCVNNGDPGVQGWLPAFRHTTGPDLRRPAVVLTGSNEARVIAARDIGGIIDIPVLLTRDAIGNVVDVAFGPAELVDDIGSWPAAIVAHDGSIWVVYSRRDTLGSSIVAAHWTLGGWTRETILTDTIDLQAMFPNVLERGDNSRLYMVANRDASSPNTTMVFNSATFANGVWTWGAPVLVWKTKISRGPQDAPDMVWDARSNLALILHDVSGEEFYALFGLDAQDLETRFDTPVLAIVNNEWGLLHVDPVTGDFAIAMMNGSTTGTIGWVFRRGGVWTTSLLLADSGPENLGILGLSDSFDIVYGKAPSPGSTSPPVQIRYARVM